jgi:hypothetical protein
MVAADPPQRSNQPHVPDGVRDLRAPGRLQVREQVELAGVICAVAGTTERNDVERIAAPERSRDHVCRVDAMLGPAGDARCSGDDRALRGRGRHRGGSLQPSRPLQLGASAQRCSGAQLGAPAKRCALHRFSSQVVAVACGTQALR